MGCQMGISADCATRMQMVTGHWNLLGQWAEAVSRLWCTVTWTVTEGLDSHSKLWPSDNGMMCNSQNLGNVLVPFLVDGHAVSRG